MTPTHDQSPFESATWAITRLLAAIVAAAVLTGSCLSGLGWWVERDGGADPAWDKPGVIEKTREAIEEVERQQEGTRAFEEE